jgi:hypothetical protein
VLEILWALLFLMGRFIMLANDSIAQNTPILSLATSAESFSIACGTEQANSQATVVIWYEPVHFITEISLADLP